MRIVLSSYKIFMLLEFVQMFGDLQIMRVGWEYRKSAFALQNGRGWLLGGRGCVFCRFGRFSAA
jgi:hypothetical protein